MKGKERAVPGMVYSTGGRTIWSVCQIEYRRKAGASAPFNTKVTPIRLSLVAFAVSSETQGLQQRELLRELAALGFVYFPQTSRFGRWELYKLVALSSYIYVAQISRFER